MFKASALAFSMFGFYDLTMPSALVQKTGARTGAAGAYAMGLLVGIVALLTCWLLIGVPFGIAAVITGDVARRRVQRGEANNPRIAMAGMVLGAISIAAGVAAIGYYAWVDAR